MSKDWVLLLGYIFRQLYKTETTSMTFILLYCTPCPFCKGFYPKRNHFLLMRGFYFSFLKVDTFIEASQNIFDRVVSPET